MTSDERMLMVVDGLVSEVGGVCAAGDCAGDCVGDWAIAMGVSSNAQVASRWNMVSVYSDD